MFFLKNKKTKKKKSDYQLFLDFMKSAKERMSDKFDKAMFDYLEEIYKKAVKTEKKKKKSPISTWISRDFEIDQERKLKEKEEENKLPHPYRS